MWLALVHAASATTYHVGPTRPYADLASAVAAAAADPGSGHVIDIDPGDYTTSLAVAEDMSFVANAGGVRLLSGNATNGVFSVNTVGITVSVTDLTLVGGGTGRVARVLHGTLALTDVLVEDVGGTLDGGAIAVAGADAVLTMVRGSFSDSVLTGGARGGFVFQSSGSSSFTDTTFTRGDVAEHGGAVAITGGALALTGAVFEDNESGKNGGAVYASAAASSVQIRDGTRFVRNESQSDRGGGALYLEGAALVFDVDGSSFLDNQANGGEGGGAVYTRSYLLGSFERVVFWGNASDDRGGAIYQHAGTSSTLRHATFCDNVAVADGGAIAVRQGAVTVQNSVFVRNTGARGGLMAVRETPAAVFLDHVSESGNAASTGGLAVWADRLGTLTALEGHFQDHPEVLAVFDGNDASSGSVSNSLFWSLGGPPFASPAITGLFLTEAMDSLVPVPGGRCDPYDLLAPAGSPVWTAGIAGGPVGAFGGLYPFPAADADADGYRFPADCDDDDPAVSPAASETVGDGVDQNCDGKEQCLRDGDGDRWGSATVVDSMDADCADPGEALADAEIDCDDAVPGVNPGEVEVPGDVLDEDCDGVWSCYVDADGDGARLTFVDDVAEPCQLGLSTDPIDCDDDDGSRSPELPEVAGNTVDEDCDLFVDCHTDADVDGWSVPDVIVGQDADCDDGAEGLATTLDCDDDSDAINPGASDVAGDGVDSDCDGSDGPAVDGDGDGFTAANDCDDLDAYVFPGADENVGDGVDQDCDGQEDCYLDDDDDGARVGTVVVSADADCDDDGEALVGADTDCDDTDPDTFPGGAEVPGDTTDDDCDLAFDCFLDEDGDGTRSEVVVQGQANCLGPNDGFASDPVDCNDLDAEISPLTNERPGNLFDEDCDGFVGCYADGDGDGWRGDEVITSTDLDCADLGEGPRSIPTDCNDNDAAVFPGQVEISGDGVDQNCDNVDFPPPDLDGDGFDGSTDCDESDAAVNPNALEIPLDATDQNCDGFEDCYADVDYDQVGSLDVVASDDLDCDDPGESTLPDDPCPEDPLDLCDDPVPHTGDDPGHTGHTGLATAETGAQPTGSTASTGDTADSAVPADTGARSAPPQDPGCGCDARPGSAGPWGGLVGLLLLRRRAT